MGSDEPEKPRSFTSEPDLLARACIERAISGLIFHCGYEQLCATMIRKGGMAVQGQPAEPTGMSVEQQHACAQQGIWRRSGEEAIGTEQGRRGPPLPRQHEPRLTKGAYSFPLVLVLFHTPLELINVLFLCVSGGTYSSVESLVPEELKSIFRFSRHI